MEPIRDTVKSVILSLTTGKDKASRENPEEILKKVLTKKEIRHIRVNYFRKGVLSVNVESSSWLYFLGLRKQEMLLVLQKHLKDLKDIRFYVGDIK